MSGSPHPPREDSAPEPPKITTSPMVLDVNGATNSQTSSPLNLQPPSQASSSRPSVRQSSSILSVSSPLDYYFNHSLASLSSSSIGSTPSGMVRSNTSGTSDSEYSFTNGSAGQFDSDVFTDSPIRGSPSMPLPNADPDEVEQELDAEIQRHAQQYAHGLGHLSPFRMDSGALEKQTLPTSSTSASLASLPRSKRSSALVINLDDVPGEMTDSPKSPGIIDSYISEITPRVTQTQFPSQETPKRSRPANANEAGFSGQSSPISSSPSVPLPGGRNVDIRDTSTSLSRSGPSSPIKGRAQTPPPFGLGHRSTSDFEPPTASSSDFTSATDPSAAGLHQRLPLQAQATLSAPSPSPSQQNLTQAQASSSSISSINSHSPSQISTTRGPRPHADSSSSASIGTQSSIRSSASGKSSILGRPDALKGLPSFSPRGSWVVDESTPRSSLMSKVHRTSMPLTNRPSLQSLRSISQQQGALRTYSKPWPAAMVYSHIKTIKSPGSRALEYARSINELATSDSGLNTWLCATKANSAPPVKGKSASAARRQAKAESLRHPGMSPVITQTPRNVSGASVFPNRADAGQAVEIPHRFVDEQNPPDALPSNLPYPALAEQQQYLHNLGIKNSPSSQSVKSMSKGIGAFWKQGGRKGSGKKESMPPISGPIPAEVSAIRNSYDGKSRQTSVPSPTGPREKKSPAIRG